MYYKPAMPESSEPRERRYRELEERWEEALRDSLFGRNRAEIEAAFATADAETARKIR